MGDTSLNLSLCTHKVRKAQAEFPCVLPEEQKKEHWGVLWGQTGQFAQLKGPQGDVDFQQGPCTVALKEGPGQSAGSSASIKGRGRPQERDQVPLSFRPVTNAKIL